MSQLKTTNDAKKPEQNVKNAWLKVFNLNALSMFECWSLTVLSCSSSFLTFLKLIINQKVMLSLLKLIFQYNQLFLIICKSVDDYKKQFKKINTELQSFEAWMFL